MAQLYVGAWPDRRTAWPQPEDQGNRDTRIPALRLHRRPVRKNAPASRGTARPVRIDETAELPALRLPLIEKQPLATVITHADACVHLEAGLSGRACLAAGGRPVGLPQQIGYCLGPRHEECSQFRTRARWRFAAPVRRLAYAAMLVLVAGLLILALTHAVGIRSSVDVSRAVGLG